MSLGFPSYVSAVSKSVSDAVATLPTLTELSRNAKGVTRAVSDSIESSSKFINKYHVERCPSCHKELNIGVISGVAYGKEFKTCVCCNRRFCAQCCQMSTCPIVSKLWHPDVKRPEGEGSTGVVCESHRRKVVVAYMLEIHEKVATEHVASLRRFLDGHPIVPPIKPTLFRESAVAMRITKLACHVASYVGYGNYARAIKYAMMGRAAIGLLLNKDVSMMIMTLMPLLEEFNLKTPNDMMCVYYLGCKTELQRKHQPDIDSISRLGVLAPECPDDVLSTLGRYVAYAQWLYAAQLPRPHDSIEWGAWYLSRIIEREGWQLLASSVDSAVLPDGSLCPAFALVVRNRAETDGCEPSDAPNKKEALLVIRGSHNLTDWRINVTREVTAFSYRQGARGEAVVTGGVHTGMLIAARGILDIFGMRRCIYMLLDQGFDMKVVGHSLGAGVASLLVADLKNGLYRRQMVRASLSSTTNSSSDSAGNMREEEDLLSDTKFVYLGLDYENVHVQTGSADQPVVLPKVQAVCYATPPCVGENLADALLQDEMVLSMINGDDIVPRLSGRNIQVLAEEIKSFSSTAELWMREDELRLKRYAKSIGKEGRMAEDAALKPAASSDLDRSLPEKEAERGTDETPSSPCAVSASDKATIEEVDFEQTKPDRGLSFDRDSVETALPIPDRTRLTSGISTPDAMVVPGRIAHFTKPRGVYQANLCDYRVAALTKISLLRDSIDEHRVSSHITALRNHRLASKGVQHEVPPVWQKSFDENAQQWARCSVCQSDPTWPFITNSEATRALVYHNCRACGKIVCVMCSPAGDSVPDSGVGEYQTIADHRIPLPSFGILNPERVCTPCYLHCYNR